MTRPKTIVGLMTPKQRVIGSSARAVAYSVSFVLLLQILAFSVLFALNLETWLWSASTPRRAHVTMAPCGPLPGDGLSSVPEGF